MIWVLLVLAFTGAILVQFTTYAGLGYVILACATATSVIATKNWKQHDILVILGATCVCAFWTLFKWPGMALWLLSMGVIPWLAHRFRSKRNSS